MRAGWRRLAAAGGLRLAVLGLIGALGASAAGGGAAALARAAAKADTLGAALSGLRTQAEALAERYDHEVSLEQQAAAADQAAQARLAAARKSERRAVGRLARLAAAE